MKTFAFILITLFPGVLTAQTPINKTLPVQKGQSIKIHFDYPELIRVSTWDKNEISITGTVSINGGENDDAFKLETNTIGNTISISNEIKDLDDIPHRVTIVRNGVKTVFRNRAEYKKYQSENGGGNMSTSEGVDMDIIIEIKVPRGTETVVESVYGMVEIKDFTGPLTVQSTYGGVDASVTERTIGELSVETSYGRIYSNLDVKFGGGNMRDEDFHTQITVKPGSGPRYSFESTYGNVYLRRSN